MIPPRRQPQRTLPTRYRRPTGLRDAVAWLHQARVDGVARSPRSTKRYGDEAAASARQLLWAAAGGRGSGVTAEGEKCVLTQADGGRTRAPHTPRRAPATSAALCGGPHYSGCARAAVVRLPTQSGSEIGRGRARVLSEKRREKRRARGAPRTHSQIAEPALVQRLARVTLSPSRYCRRRRRTRA